MKTKQPKTKVYPIRLDTVLLNQAHEVIEPSELRLRIKKKINKFTTRAFYTKSFIFSIRYI